MSCAFYSVGIILWILVDINALKGKNGYCLIDGLPIYLWFPENVKTAKIFLKKKKKSTKSYTLNTWSCSQLKASLLCLVFLLVSDQS